MTKYLRNIQFTYKLIDNNFFVDINNCETLRKDIVKGCSEIGMKILESDNPHQIRILVKRNIFIKEVLNQFLYELPQIETQKRRIVIDYSSPNIAKPFHVGHLRSTIIGNFIANINKYYNEDITRINYLGDWGTQFGLLQYGLKINNINLNHLKKDPMQCLFNAYVNANKLAENNDNVHKEARNYFTEIEQGKSDLKNWKTIRDVTVQELQKIYKRLGITFDDYHWESDYNGTSIKGLMALLESNNILYTDDNGKKIANVNNRKVAVLKSDNSTLYLSRDIAALIDRYTRYNFNEMLYVVDNSQTDHFNALFDIVKRFEPKCAEGCKHIKFGRIKGMSTRSGNVIFLNDILDEAKEKMHDQQLLSKSKKLLTFFKIVMRLDCSHLMLNVREAIKWD